jgi:transposase
MEHVGIDLGGKESQVCVRDREGTVLMERRMRTAALKKWVAGRPPSRIVMETCTESFSIADAGIAAGHQVRVVPGILVKSLGVGARGVKTDKADARALSQVSCRIDLPSVHIPSQGSRDRKTMCGMRDGLVECRTKLVNTVRGWVRAEARRLPSGDIHTLPTRIRETVKTRPAFVDRLLTSIEELTVQIGQADQELSSLAKADATCQRLMTVPGVGPVTAMRFSATVDDVARFSNAHQLESYLGLVPGEHSSGDRKQVTRITKAGSSQMRWVLVQACWVARRWSRADPMVRWAEEIEKRKGKKVAIIALARKMAGIMYAIWRDGSTYQASRGASRPASSLSEAGTTEAVLAAARARA